MNRRKFLSWLGVGAAAVVAAPSVLFDDGGICPISEPELLWQSNVGYCTLGLKEYVEYTNFSQFAISTSLDDIVANAAAELGHAAGLEINRLMAATYGA